MNGPYYILVLEENLPDYERVKRELEKTGIDFIGQCARDRTTFFNALEVGVPDLLLCNYSLPGFDGLAALALARRRFSDLPVILISGASGEEIAIEALKAGATDYVLKERLGRLGPVVQRALGEAAQRRAKKAAEGALAESEERLRLLMAGMTDYAISMLTPEGRVMSWNAGAERIVGWEAAEIIGRHISTFYTPDDVACRTPERALAGARDQGRHEEEGWRVRKSGEAFWAHVIVTPIFGAKGDLRGFVKVVQDITERRRVEEELKAAKTSAERAKTDAQAANQAKDHFLAVLSHELRTPLMPVMTSLAMMKEDRRFDGEAREQMEMIYRNVELEARLIDDLLEVTRIERGKIELDRQTVDLCVILRRAAEVCMPDIEARKMEFAIEAEEGPYLVHADVARMQQAIWNLLKNAIKFTPKRGRVVIRCRRDGNGQVLTTVTDNGVGIDPEVLPRLFNAFEQGDRRVTRQFGGLGLGLAISKAIVDLHGGELTASSEGHGKGATFALRLPMAAAGSAAPAAPAAPVSGSRASRPARILLVEDHGDTARVMQRLLSADGHTVQVAGDVATAMKLATAQAFDVMLSDLGLPDGSGMDLVRGLRAKGITLPAIALSGYGLEQDLRQSREAGFIAHLVKPVSPAKLWEAIARAVGRG